MIRQEAATRAAALGYPWIAMDEDSKWYAFQNKPKQIIQQCGNDSYWTSNGRWLEITASIDYTGDWKDSLTEGEVK